MPPCHSPGGCHVMNGVISPPPTEGELSGSVAVAYARLTGNLKQCGDEHLIGLQHGDHAPPRPSGYLDATPPFLVIGQLKRIDFDRHIFSYLW